MSQDQITDWTKIDEFKFTPEERAVNGLLSKLEWYEQEASNIQALAVDLVKSTRSKGFGTDFVASALNRIDLCSPEGLVILRLCEAILRTPDESDKKTLIIEQIQKADWEGIDAASPLLWAIREAARAIRSPDSLAAKAKRAIALKAMPAAIATFGGQFILGGNMQDALRRATKEQYLCSFDMLGEGARTYGDAEKFKSDYAECIKQVSAAVDSAGPDTKHGVSVKLSALHPRYESLQPDRVMRELLTALIDLAAAAAARNINFCLDAEESDRLVLSLQLFEAVARSPKIPKEWRGLGLAVQAYQKRAPHVIQGVAQLATKLNRRFMVRLVKGAYWDSEIKRAQINGMPDFPVFTRKRHTDISYIACAGLMLRASPHIYPQFATHNAHTLSAIYTLARVHNTPFEMQRLHGMGEQLYAIALSKLEDLRVRVYAPVGESSILLAYLVRRLLENGANSSFVHKLFDSRLDPQEIAADPVLAATREGVEANSRIKSPLKLFDLTRVNSRGVDLSQQATRDRLVHEMAAQQQPILAGPLVAGRSISNGLRHVIKNPANRERIVGEVVATEDKDVDTALHDAVTSYRDWNSSGAQFRAAVLTKFGARLEDNLERLAALIACEAGRTIPDAIAEVREAVDFCRYYAVEAQKLFGEVTTLRGPVGEKNELVSMGRGALICISPWNFPLSIFVGQIAAALAGGNTVVAKPAPQTPLIAFEAVKLFHSVCSDPRVLSLVPGDKSTAEKLICDPRHSGVVFTGSTATARQIYRRLAERDGPIVPFIAETGGLNAIFVDSTALREHIIDDVLASAFGSAGQRCSSARILALPEMIASDLTEAIAGAMDALIVGDPSDLATDIGPIIDERSRDKLNHYAQGLAAAGKLVKRLRLPEEQIARGFFVAPTLASVESLAEITEEQFGPVLHIVRYQAGGGAKLADQLAGKGYALTLGIQSRLDSFVHAIRTSAPAGNVYVNRSIIGATVESQPFGGFGLSGTGPKTGGPRTLLPFTCEQAICTNIFAQGGDPELLNSVEAA